MPNLDPYPYLDNPLPMTRVGYPYPCSSLVRSESIIYLADT